jgi:hypothetical protein
MDLSFTVAAGSRQRSHPWVQVPRDLLQYFTVSDLRLPHPVRVKVTLRLAVYLQSVRLGAEPLETHNQNFFPQMNTGGHSPYITSCLTSGWICHLQLLLVLASPVGLATIFYCPRFETSLFVASYDSQG